jgi:glucuronate isomerase
MTAPSIDLSSLLSSDRLFPDGEQTRTVARRLFESVRELPLLSPHGHTNAKWFAEDKPFPNPTELLIQPDHYIFRMLYSQGVSLEELGIPDSRGEAPEVDPREVWRIFAKHYFLFRGTPTRLWLDTSFSQLFGFEERLSADNADAYYDTIARKLEEPGFRPRALFEAFRIAVLSTTDSPLDSLEDHRAILASGWNGRVLPTFRPDSVIDVAFAGFRGNIDRLGELTGEDISTWQGYLNALRNRRAFFKENGATATDHGHLTARTVDLSAKEAEALYARIHSGRFSDEDAILFQAQMLTEMAGMSLEDGLTMQLHPGSVRNHNTSLYERFGRDKGADIPSPTEYVRSLQPLLAKFGNDKRLTLILFTLDETTYSRELAPLAGHYPAVFLGPAWWFHDSPEGMMRFRERVTETAGFYNTVGFNDDTRAFLSIPARHDVARRVDAAFLARLVAEHRLDEEEALEVMQALTDTLVRRAYKL